MDKIKRHKELCEGLHEIYKQKNTAYGDSFGRSFSDWGVSAAAIRLTDKFNRFINLAKHPDVDPNDESIIDTCLDAANYFLMMVMELENHGNN